LRQNEPSDDSERYGAKPSGAAQSRKPEAPASGARLDTAYIASLDGLQTRRRPPLFNPLILH
jgi:hypothetical protein